MANIFDTMKQLGEVAKFQKMLTAKVVERSSPGKEVTLKVNGKMELVAIEIAPEMLTPAKKVHLEKLILRIWAEAQKEIEKILMTELKPQLGNLKLPF